MSNFCQQGDITKIFIVDTGSTGSTGTDIYVTGGTYSNGTLTLGRNDGVSLLISGFLTGTTDTFITGGTYSSGTLILGRNDGVNILISGFSTTTIFTGNTSANCITDLYISNLHGCSPITVWDPIISLSSISATTYYGDGSNLTGIPDYYVTGGTFSSGALTLNRQNGSVSITGITDNFVTGGTYLNGTLTLNRQNGPVTISGFLTGTTGSGVDTFVTGFTFSSNTLTISQNQGQTPLTASITTIDLSNIFSAVTFNIGTTGSISATTFYGSGVGLIGIPDYYVTGGTYSSGTGTLTLNRQNGSVTISGFSTGGGTGGTGVDTYVTGFTYNGSNRLTISQNQGQIPLDIFINTFSGLTVNGSVSATTFFGNGSGLIGVPDNFVTGGTFNTSNRVLTLNRQNGSLNVSGFTDTFTTGFTYSNNNLTITRSQGQAPLTVNINLMTGLTINGGLTATTLTVASTSNLNGTINSFNFVGSTDRVVQVNSGGTFSATNVIINAYITSGGTVANILENTNNWDINGVFIGSGITGTYQGQKHYNNNYFFEAVVDNLFIRLIRG